MERAIERHLSGLRGRTGGRSRGPSGPRASRQRQGPRLRASCLYLTLALCLVPCALPIAQQPRDARGSALGTATLSGVVLTDDQTPRGIRNARVELSGDGQPAQSVFSDANGKFLFSELPAGRYTLVATRPGYVRTSYGAKRADRPGTPITVADGQPLDGITLKMSHGSVIAGMVRDELGQPAPGVAVRVLQYRMVNGDRILTPAATTSGPFGETTDDRGMYRVFGLAAGEYIVAATPRTLGTGDIRQMTAAEIQSVQRVLQQQSATAQTVGPSASAPPPITVAYATVFYPATTTAANAAPISLGPGEERTDIDVSLQLVRTARIDGAVITPNGVAPQTAQLVMTSSGPAISGPPITVPFNRVSPDADGKFSYSGIAPGQYTISARIANRGPGPGADPSAPADGRGRNAIAPTTLWAETDITVTGENLTGLALNMQPGMTVAGRVVVDAVNATPPDDLSRTRISLMPATTGAIMIAIGGTGAQIDSAGRFTLSDVTPGKYRFAAQLAGTSPTWSLKSAIVNGRDTLDVPLEIGPNDKIADAVLTFTNQVQEISGTLQDASGRAAPDFTVVVFPADRAYWSASRRIKTTRPGTDGRFIVRNLPAGNYRIAALMDIAPGEANDPSLLEQLVPASVPFSLAEGERKVHDIKIAGQR
jgi:hypothetical protein